MPAASLDSGIERCLGRLAPLLRCFVSELGLGLLRLSVLRGLAAPIRARRSISLIRATIPPRHCEAASDSP